jgi:hypothetical protein
MTSKKIIVVDTPSKSTRKERPIDWASASDHRLLSIAMNGKNIENADKAIDTLVEREYKFTRKQATRLMSAGRITSDNIHA